MQPGSTFIDQARKSSEVQGSHTFEDFLVRIEVEHAKQHIMNALRRGKSYTFWSYNFDDANIAAEHDTYHDDTERVGQLAALKRPNPMTSA